MQEQVVSFKSAGLRLHGAVGVPDDVKGSERRAAFHHDAFARLVGLARQRLAGESLSEEDGKFLAECKERDAVFPDVDLSWWAKVERPARV